MTSSIWHLGAKRVPYPDAGPYTPAAPKIVWHTTEGSSLPVYSGSAPHFTFNPETGSLWQHIPINRAAKSLEHPPGTVETNHANCVQVELIGFAKDTGHWSDAAYARIAKLARWIETNHDVPSRCTVTFSNTPTRLTPAAWLAYAGHCGHQHVPNNRHWDPGAFRIELVLKSESVSLKKPDPRARKRRIWRRRLAAAQKQAAALAKQIAKLKRLVAPKSKVS